MTFFIAEDYSREALKSSVSCFRLIGSLIQSYLHKILFNLSYSFIHLFTIEIAVLLGSGKAYWIRLVGTV